MSIKILISVIVGVVCMSTATGTTLSEAYAGRLTIGTAVEPAQLVSDGEFISQHFNSLVAENVMKPAIIQPREGEFNFGPADQIVDFAYAHNMKVRGHTLLWYRSTPAWFWIGANGAPASRELILQRLQHHIETVMTHYKGKVYAWDVVNEVIDPTQPNCLRNERWLQMVGADYIEQAFNFAHAVDPTVQLYLNDYNTTKPMNVKCISEVVHELKSKGTPINGIGHQMHMSIYYPPMKDVDTAFTTFERMGLENQITELDMSLYQWQVNSLQDNPKNLLKRQATVYSDLFKVIRRHPKIKSVTFWGISDAHTPRTTPGHKDMPLLFDENLQPKPAFWSIIAAK